MPNPKDTPLDKWSPGWLKMEVACLLNAPGYIMMHDHEKRAAGHPVTQSEMRDFIRSRRDAYMEGAAGSHPVGEDKKP